MLSKNVVHRPARPWPDPVLLVGESVLINLKHDGAIPADQDGEHHSDVKQELREEFSLQIRRHWRKGLLQRHLALGLPTVRYVRHQATDVAVEPDKHPFFRVDMCGYLVVPLVSWHNRLSCELEFIFLGEGVGIRDLDNQIKTVFDALRMPQHKGEVPGNMFGKGSDLFCLLEDDSLVRKFSVESRYGGGGSPPDETLLIKATVNYNDGPSHPALEQFR